MIVGRKIEFGPDLFNSVDTEPPVAFRICSNVAFSGWEIAKHLNH